MPTQMVFLTRLSNSAVPLLVTLFAALLLGGKYAQYGLYASAIHEIGHIIVYLILIKKAPRLSFKSGGVSIAMPVLPMHKTALLLSGGILANMIAVAVALVIGWIKPTYSMYFITLSNLCVALFNALPLSFSDGGRLLALFTPADKLSLLEHLFAATSALLIAVMLYILLFYGGAVLQITLLGVIIIVTIKNLDRKK